MTVQCGSNVTQMKQKNGNVSVYAVSAAFF